jgi:predicted AAA+ superfamily ATPase
MSYTRRIVDDALDALFPALPAIALEGAKGVGKTATATQRATTVLAIDDPAQRRAVQSDPDLITRVRPPVLIDEWQREPEVWDRVRRAVDASAPGGTFLLTGSAGVAPGIRIHSGAGRIVSMLMRPLTLAERGLVSPTVSLSSLLAGRASIEGASPLTTADYAQEILRSGFPGIRDLPPRARHAQLESYVDRIVERELPENGVNVRRPVALRAWLAAYGAATATDASYTVILDAATAGLSEKPARQTVDGYREHLERIFVLDPVPAWIPTFAPLRRLTLGPKHHLVDPALAAALAGLRADDLLIGTSTPIGSASRTWLGALFESLVTQSVRVYANATDARIGHLRTKNTEHEVDLVVEGPGFRTIGIEVKLKPAIDDRDVRHLNWLHAQLGDRLVDRIVVNTGPYAYRRRDGVAVIPLALLGP